MIIAKKETDRYSNINALNEEYEHITILKIKVIDISQGDLEEFFDNELTDNDSEENYFSYGISTGWDGELFCIDVEKFTEGLEEWLKSEIEEEPDEDDQSYYVTLVKKLIKDLAKYIGYDFYFEVDKK
jgi:hypothetical protein